ncbi:hypothetical protein, partial [Ideonella azotifigens]
LKLARHEAAWAAEVAAPLPTPESWPLAELAACDEDGSHTALITALRDCSEQALALSDAIGRKMFSHVGAVDHLVWQ